MRLQKIETPDYILWVSDEEIKENDFCYHTGRNIFLTFEKKVGWAKEFDALVKPIAYQPKNNAAQLDLPLLPPQTHPNCCITKDGGLTNMNKGCAERNRCLEMVVEDDVENFIEPLLKKKAKENNTIDLDAYALGLIDSSKLVYKFTIGDNGKIYLTGTYLYE